MPDHSHQAGTTSNPAQLARVLRPHAAQGGRLLLVEDDPQSGASMRRALESENIEAHVAADPEAALRLLEELDYDLVICDLHSPGAAGSEFYRCLRREHPELADRFILATDDAPIVINELFGAGRAPELIQKPLALPALLQRVTQRIGQLRRASATGSEADSPMSGAG